jgi:hypothetical protein
MDFKVADLRKKLNKLKYNAATKTDKLNALMKEYEKVDIVNDLFIVADGGTK